MTLYAGIDGGGSRTTIALADAGGELLRHSGPAGIVDPRQPAAAVEVVLRLVDEARAAAGATGPLAALCAGLAGVGYAAERCAVQAALERAGVAERVSVVGDGEIALEGAFAGGAGILAIAGTGSIAYGRGEQGCTGRCGGWGMFVGDEGSGYWIGRVALQRALQAEDGRGPPTRLLPALLDALALPGPDAVPPWVGRASKRDVAALVPEVLRVAAAGDEVAAAILDEAAAGVASHVAALHRRLGPWRAGVPVVLHGGVGGEPGFRARVAAALAAVSPALGLRAPLGDAVAGALRLARGAAVPVA